MDELLVLTACAVDLGRGRVFRDGVELQLTGVEAELLRYLAARPEQEVTRAELLVNVWKYREGVQSRAVDIATARVRKAIERDSAAPDHLFGVRGVGYRFVPSRLSPVAPPPPAVEIVGREAMLLKVQAGLTLGRPLWLVGPPGVGKTALAIACAQEVPRALFCAVGDLQDRDRLVARIAATVGLSANADSGAVAVALGKRTDLLVLDGLDAVTEVVSLLEEWSLHVRILATAQVRPADGLFLVVEPLESETAARLFRREAEKSRVDLSGWTSEAIARVTAQMDGLPLAIRWAASYADILSADQLLARLAGADLPEGPLEGVLSAVWERLNPDLQGYLKTWSVFWGRFSLEGAEAIAQTSAVEPLKELVQRNLMRVENRLGRRHFSLLGMVRRFARAKAMADAGFPRVEDRWLTEVERNGDADLPDLEAAVRRLESEGGDRWVRLLLRLAESFRREGPTVSAIAVIDRALQTPGISDAQRGACLHCRAEARWVLGRMIEAERDLVEAKSCLGAPLAAILASQAKFDLVQGRPTAEVVEQGLAEARRVGDLAIEALFLRLRGAARRRSGDSTGGRTDLLAAAGLFGRVGRAADRASGSAIIGEMDENDGRFDAAASRYSEAIAIYTAIGAHRGRALARLDRAGVHLWAGEWAEAASLVVPEYPELMREEPRWEAYYLLRAATLAAGGRRYREAAEYAETGVRLLVTVDQWSVEYALRLEAAEAWLRLGDPDAAMRILAVDRARGAPANVRPQVTVLEAAIRVALGKAADWEAVEEALPAVEHRGERVLSQVRAAESAEQCGERARSTEWARQAARESDHLRLPMTAPIFQRVQGLSKK